MIPKVNNSIKYLINSILEKEVFNMLNKPRKAFIVIVLWHILSIKGKINFLQLGRFGPLTEQTYRKQFEKTFDFLGFNMDLIKQVVSNEAVVALDPSYIPKSGKSTFGLGRFWSVVADSVKIGLDICGFAVVDVANNTALHLKAWQTPSAGELLEKGLNLLSHYASLVTENAEQFKTFSKYFVADAYFSKRPFVEAEVSTGMHFISRLRDDSILMYKYTGAPTGKKGAPKKYDGHVDKNQFDPNRFSLDLSNEEITVYSFSMADYKTLCNNTLMLERFMTVFAINPNTPKNQKIVKELLEYGKIAS